jgi:hypothetical protein
MFKRILVLAAIALSASLSHAYGERTVHARGFSLGVGIGVETPQLQAVAARDALKDAEKQCEGEAQLLGEFEFTSTRSCGIPGVVATGTFVCTSN